MTGVKYRDEILDACVQPYAAAIGNDFILMDDHANEVLMDDNAPPQQAVLVQDYLEREGLEQMEWPVQSPDLNQIEHV